MTKDYRILYLYDGESESSPFSVYVIEKVIHDTVEKAKFKTIWSLSSDSERDIKDLIYDAAIFVSKKLIDEIAEDSNTDSHFLAPENSTGYKLKLLKETIDLLIYDDRSYILSNHLKDGVYSSEVHRNYLSRYFKPWEKQEQVINLLSNIYSEVYFNVFFDEYGQSSIIDYHKFKVELLDQYIKNANTNLVSADLTETNSDLKELVKKAKRGAKRKNNSPEKVSFHGDFTAQDLIRWLSSAEVTYKRSRKVVYCSKNKIINVDPVTRVLRSISDILRSNDILSEQNHTKEACARFIADCLGFDHSKYSKSSLEKSYLDDREWISELEESFRAKNK